MQRHDSSKWLFVLGSPLATLIQDFLLHIIFAFIYCYPKTQVWSWTPAQSLFVAMIAFTTTVTLVYFIVRLVTKRCCPSRVVTPKQSNSFGWIRLSLSIVSIVLLLAWFVEAQKEDSTSPPASRWHLLPLCPGSTILSPGRQWSVFFLMVSVCT